METGIYHFSKMFFAVKTDTNLLVKYHIDLVALTSEFDVSESCICKLKMTICYIQYCSYTSIGIT